MGAVSNWRLRSGRVERGTLHGSPCRGRGNGDRDGFLPPRGARRPRGSRRSASRRGRPRRWRPSRLQYADRDRNVRLGPGEGRARRRRPCSNSASDLAPQSTRYTSRSRVPVTADTSRRSTPSGATGTARSTTPTAIPLASRARPTSRGDPDGAEIRFRDIASAASGSATSETVSDVEARVIRRAFPGEQLREPDTI
jgi:hypothetical protein